VTVPKLVREIGARHWCAKLVRSWNRRVSEFSRYDGCMPNGIDPMQVLAAAVTPVVLVSATAILISGVNSRYISIADKMRSLAQEFRSPACVDPRRFIIITQMAIFRSRIRLVAWAVRVLYSAVACFIAMVMVIGATLWRRMLESTTLPLFGLGIFLILTAIVCQLMELHLSNRTIALEVRDVTAD
jgi:hypothetical protein